MNELSLKGYSLWLRFSEKEDVELRAMAERITQITQSVVPWPHVTLVGSIEKTLEEVIEKARILHSHTQQMKLQTIGIGHSDFFYKSLFIELEKLPALMKLNEEAQQLFGRSDVYLPHISLLYAAMDEATRLALTEKITATNALPSHVSIESLSVWNTNGTHDQWKQILELPLL